MSEVKVTINGPDVATWIARNASRYRLPSEPIAPGVYAVAGNGGVVRDLDADDATGGAPYLDPEASVTFMVTPPAPALDDVDTEDAQALARAALEAVHGAIGDVQVTQLQVEVRTA